MAWGTDEQKQRYVPKIANGSEVWCEGLSEPNAGSDLAAVTTFAEWTGDRYRVTGRKIWTSFAHYADKCYLLAKTSLTERKHHNLTVLLLDMHQAGVQVSPIRQLNKMHEFNEVVFDGAEVTSDDRLGKENEGWAIVTIAGQRKSLAPGQVPRRYVHMKHEFDQLLECAGEVGFDAASMDSLRTKLDLLLWHMRRIVEAVACGEDFSRAQSVVELYWSELWQEITRAGLSLDCPRHEAFWRRKYLESRPATIYGGSSELKRNVIADRTLALPR
jgi:alkylation response protein AidB-like acyl-CoA dehydrogenase